MTPDPKLRPKRIVTVDGIRYSLDTGDSLGRPQHRPLQPRATRRPGQASRTHAARPGERPLPRAVHVTSHNQAVMHPDPRLQAAQVLHPHNVSHPTLPLQQRSESEKRSRGSLWRDVVRASFTDSRDGVGVWAAFGIVLLSPLTWLAVIIPALLIFLSRLQDRPLSEMYGVLVGWLEKTSFGELAAYIGIVAALLGAIWFVRHMCLSVSYGLASRRADNRPVSADVLWWQAAGKVWRLVWVALFEVFVASAVVLGLSASLRASLSAASAQSGAQWSLVVNILLIVSALLLLVLAIHRPLTRVMLALTNRSAGSVIVRSLGLIFRNVLPAFAMGLLWLVLVGFTGLLVAAVSWATLAYGILQITTTLGRLLLLAVSSALVMSLLMAFTIWSVDFWPRGYRWLAARAYPEQVSKFMSGQHNPKRKRTIAWQVGLLVVVYAALLIGLSVGTWQLARQQYDRTIERLPRAIESDFLR